MTNITKDELNELINQVKATDYKSYTFFLTKEMIKKYKNNKKEIIMFKKYSDCKNCVYSSVC